jgi:hypothetical protein
MQYPSTKNALESGLVHYIPLFIENFKRDIFVRRTRFKSNHAKFRIFRLFKHVLRGLRFINQFRVENVEFISLDLLWWWVVWVVMSSVVNVPVEP